MKRLHVHVSVERLDESIRFYSALFAAQPVKQERDYAKWLLDDPRVNFAISARGAPAGVDHLGIQAEDETELATLRDNLTQADLEAFDEGETVCCYARSDKSWVKDPAGVAWEAYHTMDEAEVYHSADSGGACCAPTGATTACC